MSNKLAVFNLPNDVREREVDDLFHKYGPIDRVSIRNTRGGDVMAFVEFKDQRDARDGLARHGYEYDGRTLRVEVSGAQKGGKGRGDSRRRRDSRGRGKGRYDDYGRGYGGYGGKGRYDDYYGGKGGYGKGSKSRGGPTGLKSHWFKVTVRGLPGHSSWQDLKDFLREAGGRVRYTDVMKENGEAVGVGGFEQREEAQACVDQLDGKDFKARDGETAPVTVEFDAESGGRDRSRSRGRSPAKSHRSGSRRSAKSEERRDRSQSRREEVVRSSSEEEPQERSGSG